MGTNLTPPTIHFVQTRELDLGRLSIWGLGLLSSQERAACERLRPPASKRDYLAAHLVLRFTLARVLGLPPANVRLGSEDSGRPRVDGVAIQVSLTHCEGLGACAVSARDDPAPLGIDGEPLAAASRVEEVEHLALNRAERDWAAADTRERNGRLVALWTAKEAVLKARGIGIVGSRGVNELLQIECRPETWQAVGTGSFRVGQVQVRTQRLPSGHCLAWTRLGADLPAQSGPEEFALPIPVS